MLIFFRLFRTSKDGISLSLVKCFWGKLKLLLSLSAIVGRGDLMVILGFKDDCELILCVIRTVKEDICLSRAKCTCGRLKSLSLSLSKQPAVEVSWDIPVGMRCVCCNTLSFIHPCHRTNI